MDVTPYESAKKYLELGLTVEESHRKLVDNGLDPASAALVLRSATAARLSDVESSGDTSAARNALARAVELDTGLAGREPLGSDSPSTPMNANVLVGGLIFLVGLAITVASYSAVSNSGGTYVVAWGAMAVGVVRVIKGLAS